MVSVKLSQGTRFQSTLPVRGATADIHKKYLLFCAITQNNAVLIWRKYIIWKMKET